MIRKYYYRKNIVLKAKCDLNAWYDDDTLAV